jgi:hypothetical protein
MVEYKNTAWLFLPFIFLFAYLAALILVFPNGLVYPIIFGLIFAPAVLIVFLFFFLDSKKRFVSLVVNEIEITWKGLFSERKINYSEINSYKIEYVLGSEAIYPDFKLNLKSGEEFILYGIKRDAMLGLSKKLESKGIKLKR